MNARIDSASRMVSTSPDAVYRAFATPGALERWLPPRDMTGRMVHFDFREGGRYRMRLTYADATREPGKTSSDSDLVDVRLTRLDPGRSIEQEIEFHSADPEFSGVMRMTWSFEGQDGGTLVTVRAENVPIGIRSEDHEAGLRSSLENLARFVGSEGTPWEPVEDGGPDSPEPV